MFRLLGIPVFFISYFFPHFIISSYCRNLLVSILLPSFFSYLISHPCLASPFLNPFTFFIPHLFSILPILIRFFHFALYLLPPVPVSVLLHLFFFSAFCFSIYSFHPPYSSVSSIYPFHPFLMCFQSLCSISLYFCFPYWLFIVPSPCTFTSFVRLTLFYLLLSFPHLSVLFFLLRRINYILPLLRISAYLLSSPSYICLLAFEQNLPCFSDILTAPSSVFPSWDTSYSLPLSVLSDAWVFPPFCVIPTSVCLLPSLCADDCCPLTPISWHIT